MENGGNQKRREERRGDERAVSIKLPLDSSLR